MDRTACSHTGPTRTAWPVSAAAGRREPPPVNLMVVEDLLERSLVPAVRVPHPESETCRTPNRMCAPSGGPHGAATRRLAPELDASVRCAGPLQPSMRSRGGDSLSHCAHVWPGSSASEPAVMPPPSGNVMTSAVLKSGTHEVNTIREPSGDQSGSPHGLPPSSGILCNPVPSPFTMKIWLPTCSPVGSRRPRRDLRTRSGCRQATMSVASGNRPTPSCGSVRVGSRRPWRDRGSR